MCTCLGLPAHTYRRHYSARIHGERPKESVNTWIAFKGLRKTSLLAEERKER